MTKEEARQKIAELVEKYQKLSSKEIKGFNEAATKQGFIEPLFRALSWDFENTNEVSPEENASNGRVDYAFKLNGVSQFYVEAKPLKADLNREDYIKQAVSYSYARGVTWAILTDFESLRVFNALQNKPFISLSCLDYVKQIDDIWLLSKPATVENELNKKAQAYGAMPPFIPIEKRLFKQLSQWRENLFNEIYRYNDAKKLQREQVDSIIQKLFNRLIFMRTCEDRGIEEKGLRALLNQWKTGGSKGYLITPLRQLFNEYDGYYDSELFSHHLLDEDIFIDNESLQPGLEGLYEIPGSLASYNFNDIDADVLGAVYEQYLGHVAEVTKQRAKEAQIKMELGGGVETYTLADKKERRKEHGIYYTPKYITDYIVKETVGRYLQENAGNADRLHNVKILDPACGSGSFLIRAYDELLKYHADELKKPLHQLDQWERLPILTNNIFGVDLDKQAVEVARLNLLLRSLAKREPLPYLGNNIKNGNSLISGTEEELKKYFGDKWKDKNPFNWGNEFKDIIKNGGFDVVIGNPPYVNESRGNKELFRELKTIPYLAKYYEKNMDLFNYFIEIGIDLLKEGGLISFIIPAYWQDRTGATILRNKIIKETEIINLLDLKEFKVFEDAPGQHNNVFVLRKTFKPNKNLKFNYVQVTSNQSPSLRELPPLTKPEQTEYSLINNKLIIGNKTVSLMHKLEGNCIFHLEKQEMMRGVDTSPSSYDGNGVFILNLKESETLRNRLSFKVATEFLKPFFEASQIDRYWYAKDNDYWLLYTDAYRRQLLETNKGEYSPIIEHLDKYAEHITSDNKPYGLHRSKDEDTFNAKNKILFVRKSSYSKFAIIDIPYFVDESVYIIIPTKTKVDNRYLITLFNSKMANWWFMKQKKHGDQLQIDKEQVLAFPIRSIDFDIQSEKKNHDTLVTLAEKMINLNKDVHACSDYEIDKKQQLEKEIKATDEKIDELVYDLYGLTEEERKIVEGGL